MRAHPDPLQRPAQAPIQFVESLPHSGFRDQAERYHPLVGGRAYPVPVGLQRLETFWAARQDSLVPRQRPPQRVVDIKEIEQFTKERNPAGILS